MTLPLVQHGHCLHPLTAADHPGLPCRTGQRAGLAQGRGCPLHRGPASRRWAPVPHPAPVPRPATNRRAREPTWDIYATDRDPEAGLKLAQHLVSLLRATGAFAECGGGYGGADKIASLRRAFRSLGFDLDGSGCSPPPRPRQLVRIRADRCSEVVCPTCKYESGRRRTPGRQRQGARRDSGTPRARPDGGRLRAFDQLSSDARAGLHHPRAEPGRSYDGQNARC